MQLVSKATINILPVHPPYVFQYDIQWSPPDTQMIGNNSLTSYTVEVLVVGHDTFCSCAISDKENHKLPFLANDYEDDWLYFRVAANTERGHSDFVSYGCSQPVQVVVSKSASMETRISFSASLCLIPGPP